MRIRYLGFALLTWFPGVLHAQIAAQPCSAPSLRGGFFAPKQETYSHETKLTYTCDNGRKPTVKGWWATSTCQNGKWSHEPQCIDEEACIPPEIPNAKYTENQNGWYENGHTIRITCDQGYEPKDRDVTARCITGTWSSVPVCERSIQACGEPHKIPHAVIIHQEYQEVFAVDSELQYECEDGYTVEEADGNKSIFCIAGSWTKGPTCSGGTGPGTGLVSNCGKPPIVPNGEVVETNRLFLKYRCGAIYELMGPETVECYSDGTWSEVPTCRVAYCAVDTDEYPDLKHAGVKYIKDGESLRFECVDLWLVTNYSEGRCTDGRMTFTRCCNKFQLNTNIC